MRVALWLRVASLVFCVLLLAPDRACADEYDDAVRRADRRFISALKSVTKWASGKRINGFRHQLFALILEIDPEDRRARGVLKYKRAKKGAPWVQDPEYSQPADWGTSAIPKAEAKREAALVRYRDDLFAAIDQFARENDPRSAKLLERLVSLRPEDALVHGRRGSVKHEGRWVTPDTVVAAAERQKVQAFLSKERKTLRDLLYPEKKVLHKGWAMAWKSKRRFVWGTISQRDGRLHLTSMELADRLCDRLFGKLGVDLPRGPERAMFVKEQLEAESVVLADPEWAPSLPKLKRFASIYLPDGTYLSYRDPPSEARAAAVRRVFNFGLYVAFREHERGWITEGVGQRLTYYVEGSKGPSFISTESTEAQRAGEEGAYLPDDIRTWNAGAAAVLKRDGPGKLVGVLTRRLNAMEPSDVLVAYGLAAFLMETRPKHFVAFTQATVKRHDVNAIIKETLGADDAAMLCDALLRWLPENR